MKNEEILQKVWTDAAFKTAFIANPKDYLEGEPADVAVTVLEDSLNVRHLVLPPLNEGSIPEKDLPELPVIKAALDPVKRQELKSDPRAAFSSLGITVAPETEIRAVEASAHHKYFVIPVNPSEQELGSTELAEVAGGISAGSGCKYGAAIIGAQCAVLGLFTAGASAIASGVVGGGLVGASAIAEMAA